MTVDGVGHEAEAMAAAVGRRTGRAPYCAAPDEFALGRWDPRSGVTIPVRGRTADAVLAAVRDTRLAITATSTRPPTLDDVYLRLTGDTLAA